MKIQRLQVSIFSHVWEKNSKVIHLKEFIDHLRGSRWEVLTNSYRNLLLRGEAKQAAIIKENMVAFIAAGVFRGGHAAAQIVSFSGLMMVDFDHTNERTPQLVMLFSQLPYVVSVFVSISGQGLKVIVRVDVDTAALYTLVYPLVGETLSALAHAPYDSKCSDVGRACFASHDPQAYYNPDAEVFPWRDMLPVPSPTETPVPAPSAAAPRPPQSACGFIKGMLADFERRNPFERGHRNDFLLKLGRVARYKEFSQLEFQQLVQISMERFAADDFSKADIAKRLSAGYQFVESKTVEGPRENLVSPVSGLTSAPPRDQDEGEEEEQLFKKSEALRREAPCFPDELFDRLPPLLTEGVQLARCTRERDMLLMGMLTNISGCLPGVQILYDQMYCSMHLYFIALAHAGAGKGVLALAALLPSAIHRHYEIQNQQAVREFKEATLRWNLEVKQAEKAKRIPDLSLCPEAPRLMTLKVSPNISKSRLIIYLEDNGKLGAIINAAELDMVSGAIHQDCGKHDVVLRAAFQHEEVSSDYKVDGRQVMAHEPHLACCFAGTPSQLAAFVRSLANGLYSRIIFYTGEGEWHWRSAAPQKQGTDYRAAFRKLSERLLEMHLFLLQSPTEVVFTPAQWALHTARFGNWLTEVTAEKEDSPGAIVLRHGLIAMRIAGILTALRKCEFAFATPEYICSDEDFDTAMQLVEVLLEHSLLLSTSVPATDQPVRPLKAYFRLRPIFEKLKTKFTYQEFMNEVNRQELPVSTAKRLLAKAVSSQLLVKEEGGYRKTARCSFKEQQK